MEKTSTKMNKVFAFILLPISELTIVGLSTNSLEIGSALLLSISILGLVLIVAMIIGLARFSSLGHIIFYINFCFSLAVGIYGIISNELLMVAPPIILCFLPWPFAAVYYYKRRYLFGVLNFGNSVELNISEELETAPLKWHDFITCFALPASILITIVEFIIIGAAVTKATHAFSFAHLMVCIAEIATIVVSVSLLMMLTAFHGKSLTLLILQPVLVVIKTIVLYVALGDATQSFIFFTAVSVMLTIFVAISIPYYYKRKGLLS